MILVDGKYVDGILVISGVTKAGIRFLKSYQKAIPGSQYKMHESIAQLRTPTSTKQRRVFRDELHYEYS